MNTSQIHFALAHLEKISHFIGVFALDQLPRIKKPLQTDVCAVFNTQQSYLSGEHWISFYLHVLPNGQVHGEYFDSLGAPPQLKQIILFFQDYCDTWTFNSLKIQGDTRVCGQYAIYFLSLKARGFKLSDILKTFVRDTRVNDRLVFDYVCTNYPFVC